MLELAVGIERVVHHRPGADLQDGVISDDTGDHVGQQDGDTVAWADAEGVQAGGEAVHHVFQLAVVDLIALEKQGHGFGKFLGGAVQKRGQTDVFVINRGRHAFFVAGQPGFGAIRAGWVHIGLLLRIA